MRRVNGLMPQMTDYAVLLTAFRRAFRASPRTAEALGFYLDRENQLLRLRDELAAGSYRPGPYRYFTVTDPKERLIAVSPFRDRVVHHAAVSIMEAFYEPVFIRDSYATRKDKGTHAAIRKAQACLRRQSWYFKADIYHYFASVSHDTLISILSRKIKDARFLHLLERIIRHGGDSCTGRGLPIGNLTSQFFANVYLNPFDHYVKESLRVPGYVRYMDDFLLFADDRHSAAAFRKPVEDWLAEHAGLHLKPKAVMVNSARHGLSFLGTRIFPGTVRLRRENLARSLKRLKLREHEYRRGQINDRLLSASAASVAAHLASFDTLRLRRAVFSKGGAL